jgi:hypothetical protein
MPTNASTQVPPPKSWDEFEEICLDAAKLRWNSSNFFRNGRTGQKQNGVDIYDGDGLYIGLQCKNTWDQLPIEAIQSEIKKAESFKPKLNHLYIATTAKRDVSIQKQVREISETRKGRGEFAVDVLFWDDVHSDLANDDAIFFKYYPQHRGNDRKAKEHDLSLLNKLKELLCARDSSNTIEFIKNHNWAGFPFRHEILDPIREFYSKWGNSPEREFNDPDLEKIRKNLYENIDGFYGLIVTETFTRHVNATILQEVPPEWEYEKPEHFRRVVQDLKEFSKKIVESYAELVRFGRKTL